MAAVEMAAVEKAAVEKHRRDRHRAHGGRVHHAREHERVGCRQHACVVCGGEARREHAVPRRPKLWTIQAPRPWLTLLRAAIQQSAQWSLCLLRATGLVWQAALVRITMFKKRL